jgi:hypothetical protein
MPDVWPSLEDLDRLEALVHGLLARHLTSADLPHMRYALDRQQALVELAYMRLAQLRHLVESLTLEVQTLRQIIADQEDEPPWEQSDFRW